jgi:hypothetical protein
MFALLMRLPAELCSLLTLFLSANDSFAALMFLRSRAGNYKHVQRRKSACGANLTYVNGLLHSVCDEPSYVYNDTPFMEELMWHRNGLPHRDNDAPAFVRNLTYRNTLCEGWALHGVFHRAGQPALITTHVPSGDSVGWFYLDGIEVAPDAVRGYNLRKRKHSAEYVSFGVAIVPLSGVIPLALFNPRRQGVPKLGKWHQ